MTRPLTPEQRADRQRARARKVLEEVAREHRLTVPEMLGGLRRTMGPRHKAMRKAHRATRAPFPLLAEVFNCAVTTVRMACSELETEFGA